MCCSQLLFGQWDAGIELQAYPTGIIPGLSIDKAISDQSAINFRIGYQSIDHRDLGVHLNEEGNGWGFSVGYKKFKDSGRSKWFGMVRSDIWFNRIDWYDQGPNDIIIEGQTDITVLQPTATVGYSWNLGSNTFLSPSLSFGWEWNIKTSGAPTGQGAILLIGVTIARRL